MSKLVLQNVSRNFGDNKGVFDVNLEIEDGEFFVILGPSGCGKTTTLRMIAGLEIVDSGHIYLNEQEITNFPPRLRNIAMVFQNYALYPFMTVKENIEFPLKVMKMSKKDRENKSEEVAKVLGISDLLDRKPGEISGGQRQRVALGRALVREPTLFLMDEPLSNLDAKLRTQMRVELKRLQREFNTTTVYVTHDQVEATTLGDRACVMNQGKVVQLGSPLDLYELPADIFVATFVGDPPMNILHGKLIGRGGSAVLQVEGFSLEIEDIDIASGETKDVKMGMRPEDTTIADKGIEATLVVKQNIGKNIYEYFKTKDGFDIVKQDTASSDVQVGEKCHLAPLVDKLMIFDEATGNQIYKKGKLKI